MPIPGKYCFGILEEDNPLKSYFRFKPLLIENEGKYERFAESDSYPEDGCIRIVPDKNESSRFKVRMRHLGRYAVVDLRNHPNENDKIRPNKNYRGDGAEQNANIIYSDVVQAPLAGSVLEIIDLDIPADSTHMALTMPMPGTKHVLVRGSDGILNLYIWAVEAMENIEGGVALRRTDALFSREDVAQFDVPGFHGEELHFILAQPDDILVELPDEEPAEAKAEPAAPAAADETAPQPESQTPKAEAPVETPAPEAAAKPAPRAEGPEAPAHAPAEAPRAHAPKPEAPKPAKSAPVHAERPERQERQERPRGRLGSAEQALQQQTGLNPRRGRSLQEIIDEKWRHSRLDQLGHPVPPEATGNPVVSPVERALYAVREAWALPESRPSLRNALCGVEGLINEAGAAGEAAGESRTAALLNDLEAQRLKLLDEIATLKAGRIETHEHIVEEIRAGNARLFEEGEKKLAAQRAELGRLEKQISEASAARKAAEAALAELAGPEGQKRLSELALSSSALSLGGRLRAPAAIPRVGHAAGVELSAGELISAVRSHFECAGHALDNDEAVNLLACFALSPVTILSGAAGSGKSSTAALLAESLGIVGAERCLRLTPGREPLDMDPAFRELTACADVESPLMALVEDVNTRPRDTVEPFYAQLDAPGANPALRLVLTAQDGPAGFPLSARLLDRAFMIRLNGEAAATDWAPLPVKAAQPAVTVSEATLRAVFAPDADAMSETVNQHMQALRAALSAYGVRLSRRTLTAIWTYCAAATRLMQRDAMQVFDLAFAERALPAILAAAPLEALHRLPELLKDMPVSRQLLNQPLPVEV